MQILVGLGNPGEKYKNNRHNVGFMFIDYLLNKLTDSQINRLKKKKMLYVTCYMLDNIILSKPQTFMNRSGEAVKKLTTTYHLKSTDLIVVHDDLDIPLGKFKIQQGTGPRLHNGIESIENALGRKDFWRIRIGIDNRLTRGEQNQSNKSINGETYVLQDFTSQEKKIIYQIFPKILARLKNELAQDLSC